jgi:hypothetical protein
MEGLGGLWKSVELTLDLGQCHGLFGVFCHLCAEGLGSQVLLPCDGLCDSGRMGIGLNHLNSLVQLTSPEMGMNFGEDGIV